MSSSSAPLTQRPSNPLMEPEALFPDDLYMLTEEPQPLSTTSAPPSPDYTPATPHTDDESESLETSETRTSPTLTPPRAFYYRSTAQMILCTQPTLSFGYPTNLTKDMALLPSSFRKRYISSYETPSSSSSSASSSTLPSQNRYRGTSELIVDIETESDESEDEGTDSKSEEAASENQQHQAVPAKDPAKDELVGLGYRAARRCAFERAGDTVPSTYEVVQSSKSTPDQQIAGETPTETHTRLHVCSTWKDPEEGTIYIDIECDIPLVRSPAQSSPSLVGTPASLEWFPKSLPVSPVILSPVATPAPAATLDKGDLLEIGAQLELHGSILHTHTKRLDVLPPTLFEGYGQHFTKLFSRSKSVHKEIHSQRFSLRNLKRV
nr:hypothetical protein [Tanacetum cinerariifolium]